MYEQNSFGLKVAGQIDFGQNDIGRMLLDEISLVE